jgi:bifunctional non-homologous end joining protein LigD
LEVEQRPWIRIPALQCCCNPHAEVKYLTWTEDNLLRQVVYEGLREDKPVQLADLRRTAPQ